MSDDNSSSPPAATGQPDANTLKKQSSRLLYPEVTATANTAGREGKLKTAPILPDELKKQTTRISLAEALAPDQRTAATREGAAPPGITPEAAPLPATPKTIQLKRPASAGAVKLGESGKIIPATIRTPTGRAAPAPTAGRDPLAEEKSKTSRVVIEDPTIITSADNLKRSTTLISGVPIPQTIQLKRPPPVTGTFKPVTGTFKPPAAPAKSPTAPLAEAPTVARAQLKPQTSRIFLTEAATVKKSLDAKPATGIISGLATPAAAPIPQTIRLKRPVSSAVMPAQPGTAEAASLATAKKSETAKIELPTEAPPIPLTQRKTIKIKRTERNVAPRTVMLPRAPAAAGPETATSRPAPAAEPSTENIIFAIAAAAAVVLAAGLVYLLVAQGSGPNLVLPVPSALL